MDWIVFILRCADGTLYTGITNDLVRRMSEHGSGRGGQRLLQTFTVGGTDSHHLPLAKALIQYMKFAKGLHSTSTTEIDKGGLVTNAISQTLSRP